MVGNRGLPESGTGAPSPAAAGESDRWWFGLALWRGKNSDRCRSPDRVDAGTAIHFRPRSQAGGDGGANGDGHDRIKKTRLESRAFS